MNKQGGKDEKVKGGKGVGLRTSQGDPVVLRAAKNLNGADDELEHGR
jgi:hypothetical protein